MTPHRPHHPDNPHAGDVDDAVSAPRFVVTGGGAGFLSEAAGGGALASGAGPGGEVVALDQDQSRHALRVLRLSVGDRVRLLDGRGGIAVARVSSAQPGRVLCAIDSVRRVPRPTPHLTLASAIPKGPRGDAMSNDLAQLGADVLLPMRTARGVVVPGGSKLARYHKQAAEAAKQCGRAWLMEVAPLTGFDAVLAAFAGADADTLKLLADPGGEPTSAVVSRLKEAGSVVVLVGPEGGLTEMERQAARDAGFVPWRFAPNILRVETAAAAAVAVLRSLT